MQLKSLPYMFRQTGAGRSADNVPACAQSRRSIHAPCMCSIHACHLCEPPKRVACVSPCAVCMPPLRAISAPCMRAIHAPDMHVRHQAHAAAIHASRPCMLCTCTIHARHAYAPSLRHVPAGHAARHPCAVHAHHPCAVSMQAMHACRPCCAVHGASPPDPHGMSTAGCPRLPVPHTLPQQRPSPVAAPAMATAARATPPRAPQGAARHRHPAGYGTTRCGGRTRTASG
eukprot:337435-Chlamydomonas_euryale.AAC.2